MKISQVLDLIDSGDIALPEFQRGYVWNREQVRRLFTSLYRGYPVGSFMTWNTKAEGAAARGGPVAVDGTVRLLLDGQQRATTLYGVIRGVEPAFFEGKDDLFTGLYFHLDEESFEFYGPAKMANNPRWVNVTRLMNDGLGAHLPALQRLAADDTAAQSTYIDRLNRITQITNRDVHFEEVTGADKTIDTVVEIFNQVNSGGTKLSKGDLALAQIGASWPEARQRFNAELHRWDEHGYTFTLDWLLRAVNGVITGEAPFSALQNVAIDDIQQSFGKVGGYVDQWLNIVAGQLGLDHDRVMFSKSALVILARYAHLHGGKPPPAAERDRLLYWFIHAGMWGRYAGSTETVLTQDLQAVEGDGAEGLIRNLEAMRGSLQVRPEDFSGNSMGARFYPVLYLLTRTSSAKDWGDGTPLSAHLLGKLSGLQVHHIFPKARLYEADYERGEVNAIANFCFLTQGTNLDISATPPADYMPQVEHTQPGALASQWIPDDPDLLTIERYPEFLEARRQLLAYAANALLDRLLSPATTAAGDDEDIAPPLTADLPAVTSEVVDADPDLSLEVGALVAWLTEQGFAPPTRDVEVADPDKGEVLAVADAFWSDGLQPGAGEAVLLQLDTSSLDAPAIQAQGYRLFTSCASLRDYILRQHSVETPQSSPG